MKPTIYDREITIERKAVAGDDGYVAPDTTYGTERTVWVPLVPVAGSPVVGERFPANVQDVMPSRSESVAQGLAVGRDQTRIRIRWRDDVTSAMRITLHGETDTVWQIVGGPAEIGGRKNALEMVCEKFTS